MIFAATAVMSPTHSANTIDLVMQAGPIAKFVLLLLLVASVFSWGIIFMKHSTLRKAEKESAEFLNMFWYGQDLEEVHSKSDQFKKSPVASVFKSGFKELKKISQLDTSEAAKNSLPSGALDNISRSLTRATMNEITTLEKSVGILATIGSTAPFIGLFGTVWGIMDSFQGIGATGNANLAVVAPGISEALIATAAGLVAAIPAVMGYNFFINKIKHLATDMDAFSQDFLNLVQRSVFKA